MVFCLILVFISTYFYYQIILPTILLPMKKLLISSLVLCFSLWLVIAQDSNQDIVSRLHSKGLTKYSSANDFRPYDSITRGEAAKFMVEYAKIQNLAKIKTSSECIFSDTNSYDVSLAPYITEACEYWLFKWFNGNYMPTNLITKGEAITVTIRSIFWIQNEQGSPRYTEYYNKWNNLNLTLWNINSFELPINRITLGLWLKESYENGSNDKPNQEPKIESTTSFQTIILTASWTELTDKISLKKWLYRFSFTHDWERNFIVKLLNSDWKTIEYLANEIWVVDSSLWVNIPADWDYYMNVDADGTWNISDI